MEMNTLLSERSRLLKFKNNCYNVAMLTCCLLGCARRGSTSVRWDATPATYQCRRIMKCTTWSIHTSPWVAIIQVYQ